MATRRPKVPRASPAAHQSKDTSDGADVIRADFGGRRNGPGAEEEKPAAAPGKNTAASRLGASVKAGVEAGKQAGNLAGNQAGKSAPGRPASGRGAAPGTPGTASSRKASGAEAEHNGDPVPAKAFSGRMLALAVVMIAITIMLAPTVKIFIDKRAEIAALEADIAARKAQQDGLKLQVSRWQDPNYVKQQARDRINMVMPGETGYWVFGSDLPAGTTSGQPGTASAQDPANLPWVDSLWESIRRSATD